MEIFLYGGLFMNIFYKIVFTPHTSLLTKKERIFAVSFYTGSVILMGGVAFLLTKLMFLLYYTFVSTVLVFGITFLGFVLFGKLDLKYDFSGENDIKPSYKLQEFMLISQIPTIITVMLILLYISIKYVTIKWSILLLFLGGLVYPILGMYKRMHVFNSIGLKEGIGYCPIIYFFISGFLGFMGYYRFIVLRSVMGIIFIFLMQTLLLYPEKFNKILPIDNKTNGGFIIFLITIIIIYSIGVQLITSI